MIARQMGAYLAVAAEIPTGFGPTVWAGELRHNGQPVAEHAADGGGAASRWVYPMTVGRDADEVFAGLQARADKLTGTSSMTTTAYEVCSSCKGSGLQDGMYGPVECWVCGGQCIVRIRDERGRFAVKAVPEASDEVTP